MPMYGYARVSTRDQDLAAQDAELMAAGCAKVFKEKISGSKTDRPELAKAIRRLEFGDVLVVTRLDRLARSTRDLLNVLDEIGKRGAGFRSLKDTWADTTTCARGLAASSVIFAARSRATQRLKTALARCSIYWLLLATFYDRPLIYLQIHRKLLAKVA